MTDPITPPPAPEPTPYAAAPQASPYAAPAGALGQKTNTLSIVSLILSIIGISLGGIITGHIALSQIKKTGEAGHGLALAGTIIGYVGIAVGIIVVIFWVIIAIAAASNGYTSSGY